jgi:hypothetical protein
MEVFSALRQLPRGDKRAFGMLLTHGYSDHALQYSTQRQQLALPLALMEEGYWASL